MRHACLKLQADFVEKKVPNIGTLSARYSKQEQLLTRVGWSRVELLEPEVDVLVQL